MAEASESKLKLSELLSPGLLSELRRVELRTRRSIDSTLVGSYRSAFRGSGLVFSDLREYQPGDDTKQIHWKATARTGKVYVKSYEEERLLNIVLAVDISGSTGFGADRSKHRRALEFAALLTMLAAQTKDAVGLCLFGGRVEEYLRPSAKQGQIHRIIYSLLQPRELLAATDVSEALHYIRQHQKRSSIIFVISDFLSAAFEEELKFLGQRHDVILALLQDRLDYELPRAGLVQMRDAESGQLLLLDTSRGKVASSLKAAHARRVSQLKELTRSCGADFMELEKNPLTALATLMHRRTARQR